MPRNQDPRRIAEQKNPGFKAVARPADDAGDAVPAVDSDFKAPSMQAIRDKFAKVSDAAAAGASNGPATVEDVGEIVRLQSEGRGDRLVGSKGSVIVDGKETGATG